MRSLSLLLIVILCAAGLAAPARAQPHPIDPQPAIHVLQAPGIDWASVVESLGDLDGDGAADFAASAPTSGFVRVYSGRTGASLYDFQGFNDQLGHGLGGGGDLDGDAVPDFVLGAPFGLPAGFVRAHSGADGHELWTATGQLWGLGSSCDVVGDLNADGRDDVVAGDPLFGLAGSSHVGRVLVLSGADGSVQQVHTGQLEDERFGEAVAAAGDVDGDGAGDFLVGSPSLATGRALLISGATGARLHEWIGTPADCAVGSSVAGAGDVDGDGVPDLVIGDRCHTTVEQAEGVARVYSGADWSLLYTLRGEHPRDFFGHTVAAAGDLDGDGRDDVLGGALGLDTERPFACAYSGLDGHVLFRFEYDIAAAFPANDIAVRGAGDVDGNGSPDVLIGLPPAAYGAGALYVFGRSAVAWKDVGASLAGMHAVPGLSGDGVPAFGETITLELDRGTPRAPFWIVAGTGQVFVPFLGGVLAPSPDLVLGPFVTDSSGAWGAAFTWPDPFHPGTTWTLQAWIADGSGPQGFVASNAIAGTVH